MNSGGTQSNREPELRNRDPAVRGIIPTRHRHINRAGNRPDFDLEARTDIIGPVDLDCLSVSVERRSRVGWDRSHHMCAQGQ